MPGDEVEMRVRMYPREVRRMPSAVNPVGGSGAAEGRDGAATPLWLTRLIGHVALDPCGNARSTVESYTRCIGDLGDNGLVEGHPGRIQMRDGSATEYGPLCTVFINPPFARGQVIRWVRHYRHTRFIFLLRFDPSTRWFRELIAVTDYLWFPNQRIEFVPPPGVTFSSNPYPHALFLRDPDPALVDRLAPQGYLTRVDSRSRRVQTSWDGHQSGTIGGGEGGQTQGGTGRRGGRVPPARGGDRCPHAGASRSGSSSVISDVVSDAIRRYAEVSYSGPIYNRTFPTDRANRP